MQGTTFSGASTSETRAPEPPSGIGGGEEKMKCSFCGKEIKKGTGVMFVKKDGTIFNFCSSKCEKNTLKLKRNPRNTKWTNEHHKIKKGKGE